MYLVLFVCLGYYVTPSSTLPKSAVNAGNTLLVQVADVSTPAVLVAAASVGRRETPVSHRLHQKKGHHAKTVTSVKGMGVA